MFCFTFIIFSKTISLTCVLITLTKSDSEKLKKYLYDRDTKYYIEKICNQFPDLYVIQFPMTI